MPEPSLAPRPAFAGLFRSSYGAVSATPALVVSPRPGLQLATVIARKGARADLAGRLDRAFGLELPGGACRTRAGRTSVLGTGPRAWLVVEEDGADDLAGRLTAALGSTAAISDQSDGYAVLRVAGARARDVLAKGLALDLHPRAFHPRQVAVSLCVHIGVTIWRADDDAGFDLALFRSYAGSFGHWLAESATEFGAVVRGA